MSDFDTKMEALRKRFIERAHNDRASLYTALATHDFTTVRNLAHALAGIAGIFGYNALGASASALEEKIEATSGPDDMSGVQDAAHALLMMLDQLD
jgi:HPt (histidine-containing phosphotransfer) domain-containing protein